MNIYIPIEIKVRELEGRTLQALTAAERGHTVILGEKKDTIGLAVRGLLPPGLVHMKSITPHKSMINTLTRLKEHGHRITVQDEEGGFLDETYDTFAKLRYSEESISLVDRVCAWGDYDSRSLIETYINHTDKFSVTGSPRADFWRKDFEQYYRNSNNGLTIEGKPYIMVASNFGGPLNVNRFWNVMARLNKAGYFDREEDREKFEFENAGYQTRLIGEFVFMIRDLAKSYPDHQILVRPHPVESIEGWEKLIGNIPGVSVHRTGTISRWLRHADVIIHNGCTSALEAAISGENRIAYRPIPNKIEREIPNKVSLNAFSLEELKEYIDDILDEKNPHESDPNYSAIQELLDDRFANTSGKLAADHIVDVWDSIQDKHAMTNTSAKKLLSIEKEIKKPLFLKIKSFLAGIRNTVFNIQPKSGQNGRLLQSTHKFPEFTDHEFESILKSLRTTLNRFESIEYKRFGPKSFVIFKK